MQAFGRNLIIVLNLSTGVIQACTKREISWKKNPMLDHSSLQRTIKLRESTHLQKCPSNLMKILIKYVKGTLVDAHFYTFKCSLLSLYFVFFFCQRSVFVFRMRCRQTNIFFRKYLNEFTTPNHTILLIWQPCDLHIDVNFIFAVFYFTVYPVHSS